LLRQTIGAYPINVFLKAFNLHKKTPLVWVSTSLPSSLFCRKKQKTGEASGDKSTTYQHLPHPTTTITSHIYLNLDSDSAKKSGGKNFVILPKGYRNFATIVLK
jgi:hypothetical protein